MNYKRRRDKKYLIFFCLQKELIRLGEKGRGEKKKKMMMMMMKMRPRKGMEVSFIFVWKSMEV